MSVGIVGLGLMGGSLGLDICRNGSFGEVLGYDLSKQNAKEALGFGLIETIASFDEVMACDIVVLAVPVDATVEILRDWNECPKNRTVIDLGSTKEGVLVSVKPVVRQNFVAAHPMTGTEYSGPQAAKSGLYIDKTVVLCDLDKSGAFQREQAKRLFDALGAKIVQMDSVSHDSHAAFISHLPHIISFSLANTVLSQEDPQSILTLAAGGFRDMSRLAKSSPVMWEQIFRQNRENLLDSIDKFQERLDEFRNALEGKDWQELHRIMGKANELQKIFS